MSNLIQNKIIVKTIKVDSIAVMTARLGVLLSSKLTTEESVLIELLQYTDNSEIRDMNYVRKKIISRLEITNENYKRCVRLLVNKGLLKREGDVMYVNVLLRKGFDKIVIAEKEKIEIKATTAEVPPV